MPPDALAGVVARSFAPAATLAAGSVAAVAAHPWPMAVDAAWGCVRVDGTWHTTYWVAQWPRIDVGPDFLAPLLLLPDVRRSVAVTMEPVPPLVAARQAEQARLAVDADDELRRQGGYRITARRRRAQVGLVRREAELADGHADYRFAGYVTVTADDRTDLDEACRLVEQAAGQAGLVLRPCYGEQASAVAATLPFGTGLR